MTLALDISGQRFHKLKARRFTGKRDENGRRLWLFDCDCGGTKTTTVDAVTTGHTKSCGCLHRENGRATRFTKRKALAAYKKSRQKHDGEWWLAPRRTDRYLNVNKSTRLGWAISCPWRGGKGIRTRPCIDGFGRELDFYAEKDCKEIRDNRADFCPDVPDHTHVDDACKKIGISLSQLEIEMRDAHVKPKRERGKSKDGRARFFSYVPDSFVNKLAAERSQGTTDRTVREVAKELGISIAAVYSAIRRKLLKASSGRPNCKAGYKRKGPTIAPAEVERYRAYRRGETAKPTNGRPGNEKRKGGRPKGKIDPAVAARKKAMLEAWDHGEFGSNKAAAARAFNFHRPDASKWIREHKTQA